MPARRRAAAVRVAMMAAAFALSACDENVALTNTVNRLNDMADECLLDTRDRGKKYEASEHCQKLGSLLLAYLDAGGGDQKTPKQYEVKYHQARATAWSALAVSHSGNSSARIW